MTWSTVNNFNSAQSNIVGQLNQYSANMRSLRLFNDHGVLLSLSDDIDVPDSTYEPIPWDVELDQVGGIWTPGDPTKLYAPVDGFYTIVLNVEWRTSASGERIMGFEYSFGPNQVDLEAQGALLGGGNLSGIELWGMSAGQSLTMNVYQSSGGTIGIRGNGRDRTSVAMWMVGV